MYYYVQNIINVHSRRLRRRECTSIYAKLFLRNKYCLFIIKLIDFFISLLYNVYIHHGGD